jgi:hypothetical protein
MLDVFSSVLFVFQKLSLTSPVGIVRSRTQAIFLVFAAFGLESREYDRRDPSRWPRGILYPQKLSVTSPVGIVRSRTQAMEFSFLVLAACGLESREDGRRDLWRWPRGNLYPQKLSLASPVGIAHSRTQGMKFSSSTRRIDSWENVWRHISKWRQF